VVDRRRDPALDVGLLPTGIVRRSIRCFNALWPPLPGYAVRFLGDARHRRGHAQDAIIKLFGPARRYTRARRADLGADHSPWQCRTARRPRAARGEVARRAHRRSLRRSYRSKERELVRAALETLDALAAAIEK